MTEHFFFFALFIIGCFAAHEINAERRFRTIVREELERAREDDDE